MSASATVPVPESLEEALSPQWLTAALAPRYPGIEVHRATAGPVVSRVSTNVRFTIEFSGTGAPGPSSALCVKGYFNEIGRANRHIGEAETYFYRDMAAELGVRTLESVYADVDPATRHGVLLTEDLVAAGGQFLDAAVDYTPDQAASSLRDMARMHATTWNSPQWADVSWLSPRIGATLTLWGEEKVTAKIGANMFGPNGKRVPEGIRDPERIFRAYERLVSDTKSAVNGSTEPWCVIHGDTHPGNLILDPTGKPALVDWQLVQRGLWYLDVGYHLAATLTVSDRRRTEADLLRHYLGCLVEFGVDAPSFDAAWECLGRGMLHGLYLWSITSEVEPALIEILVHRLGTAAADHDSVCRVLDRV